MSTWITRCGTGPGLRVAVKDLIDMAGLPTTAGSRAVADEAEPAGADAACLAGVRAAEAAKEATVVGKANLHELAFGISGINPWFGTPVNPLDARRVPGGSSSGSAVAVAAGEADVGIGTDTGGSVRIPAACCGIAGLKTTWGRVPVEGVRPLAPSLDTVGPLARDVAGLVDGMGLLEPGFREARGWAPAAVGRLRLAEAPAVRAAIDAALRAAELPVTDVELPSWAAAGKAASALLGAQAWAVDGHLVAGGRLGDDVTARLLSAREAGPEEVAAAEAVGAAWYAEVSRLLSRVEVLALPTLLDVVPLLEEAEKMLSIRATIPINLAGLPALALPIPADPLPASLQLVGPPGSEERLLAVGRRVEAAVSA